MAPTRARCPDQELLLRRGERDQQLPLLHRSHNRFGAQQRHDRRHVHELQAVIGMANETNKLRHGYQVEIDEQSNLARTEIEPTSALREAAGLAGCAGAPACCYHGLCT